MQLHPVIACTSEIRPRRIYRKLMPARRLRTRKSKLYYGGQEPGPEAREISGSTYIRVYPLEYPPFAMKSILWRRTRDRGWRINSRKKWRWEIRGNNLRTNIPVRLFSRFSLFYNVFAQFSFLSDPFGGITFDFVN